MFEIFSYERDKFQIIEWFEDNKEKDVSDLLANCELVTVPEGTRLYTENQPVDKVFLIKKGFAKCHMSSGKSNEYIFQLPGPGFLLGYQPLLCDEAHPHSLTTITTCSICIIDRNNFLQLIALSPEFKQRLLVNMSHEYGYFVEFLRVMAKYTVRERIALFLLVLDVKFNQRGIYNIPLKREEMANIVSTALETFVRTLKEFKDDNVIEVSGRYIKILNRSKLHKITRLYN
ncbi:MAG: Crp/Fnr family transcriptional regulator [Flavobacteriaceae bacterium]|nr:Crp/Fnr family transcriptional regulator [Flavobacteriaceae bacterium]